MKQIQTCIRMRSDWERCNEVTNICVYHWLILLESQSKQFIKIGMGKISLNDEYNYTAM